MMQRLAGRLGPILACLMLAVRSAKATDEIQVYNAEINAPGQFSLQLHGNYVPHGRPTAGYPGGMIPDGAFNGTPEFALGLKDFWEVGLYLPYAVTPEGGFESGGGKLRTLFVSPHAHTRAFFWGLNFELGYAPRRFAENHWNAEVRPILGGRGRVLEVIVNPIVDLPLSGRRREADFAPAARLALILSPEWAAGVEHYADYGPVHDFLRPGRREQVFFVVADYQSPRWDLNLGIGRGSTAGSDDTIVKGILSRTF